MNTTTEKPELHFNELLRQILEVQRLTLAELVKLNAAAARRADSRQTSTVAPDSDLDSQYGDEEIKAKMPRDWTGENYTNRRMSECPPELLDMLADRHDYFASKNREANEKQKEGYELRSARRARGWAARKRAGWKSPTQDTTSAKDYEPKF
jgi:hypothetical protein